ncbi:hypothetical protein [Agreia sp. COWG]|uniref:hypothetical protein n=1 Tax=Agreia sp. COWG TaxID=2773266 RepID=UPI0019273332|nr:hypothetical protein [Agreia sp. COWG]CAD5990999.1 Pectate lyase [Agreia sp. COWG]
MNITAACAVLLAVAAFAPSTPVTTEAPLQAFGSDTSPGASAPAAAAPPADSPPAASLPAVEVDSLIGLEAAIHQHEHHIIITADLDAGSIPKNVDVRDPAESGTVIEGATRDIALINLQFRIVDDSATGAVHDITVRNLTMHGRVSDLVALSGEQTRPGGVGTNYEAISVRGARYVTIDQVTAYDTTDDLMSVTRQADQVTISNCDLYYTREFANIDPAIEWNWSSGLQPLAEERLGLIVGNKPSDSYFSTGLLHVTLSNNHIGSLVRGRPLLRGYVQVIGNTFDNTAPDGHQYAAIEVGSGGYVVVTGNTFDHSNNPIMVHLNDPADPYSLHESNNTYLEITGSTAPEYDAGPVG